MSTRESSSLFLKLKHYWAPELTALAIVALLGAPLTALGSRLRLTLQSEYQHGTLSVDVLTPDSISGRLRVIYVLPVEPLDEHVYGSGLDVIQHLNLQNRYNVIFVAPTFAQMPWYADNPTDPSNRQESYLIHAVVPLVAKHFPTLNAPRGRLLLGFSKSGWGAFSLLLRHPDVFGGAAAWDAPLAKLHPDAWNMIDVFGTQRNFDSYCISYLLRRQGRSVGKTHRFVLMGYGLFRDDVTQAHALMTELGIQHIYSNDCYDKHAWDADWMSRAIAFLLDAQNSGLAEQCGIQ